jgi:pimeloyl-ACP methyl ester carboxylesterase
MELAPGEKVLVLGVPGRFEGIVAPLEQAIRDAGGQYLGARCRPRSTARRRPAADFMDRRALGQGRHTAPTSSETMNNPSVRTALAIAIAALVPPTAIAAQRADPPGFERYDCAAPLAALGAVCGTYPVFEDRTAAAGRIIGLNVVVIPARGGAPATEAITFLAGGPGSAVTDAAPFVLQLHASLLQERDFLFVDQRGTGGSNPLVCELYDPEDPLTWLGDYFPPAAIRTCRTRLEEQADLRLYTTAIAADDLDEVRAAFGYETLTLHGVSYGTRAALVYMRRHPERVRAAVLEGAAPPDAFMPIAFARDAQRALDGVLAACEADAACSAAFPTVREDARRAFAGLEAGPAEVRVLEPARGDLLQVPLSRDLAAEAVRYMLYSAGTARFLPVALNRAAGGDYGALAEFALFGRTSIVASGANGMYLSVTCAEDLPWVPEGAGEAAAEGTFLRDYRLRQQRTACELWPRGDVPSDFADPVHVPVPTLILSGEWDPVTPPAQGDVVDSRLPASRHLVIPHAGHGAGGLTNAACVHGIVTAFMARASTDELDTACLATVRRGPFATENPAPAPVPIDDAELDALTGDYEGVGVPIQAAVSAGSGRLRLEFPDGQHVVLVPAGTDRFRPVGMFGAAIEFERAEGELRMTLYQGGQPELTLRRR